uniref:Cytochrome c oxidase subunit 7B, mitochondrial n=1 Tax=Fundulus heteroclitus TaxID=8078 RepID=A0A3Q2NTP3_FUNHE
YRIEKKHAWGLFYRGATPQDFHSKYGLGVLVSGTVFYSLVWGYVLTETRIEWNLSPVKRVIEKNW